MFYEQKIKDEIIEKYKSGVNIKQICAEYGVSRASVYNWLKDKNVLVGNKKVTYGDYKKLKELYDRKCVELDTYMELHCFKDSSTKEKEEAIKKNFKKYPMKVMCRLLDIPKGTAYNFIFRKTENGFNKQRDENLKQEILKIFKESGERFGSLKISEKLRTMGINTTYGKVKQLMMLLNIHPKCSRKRKDNIEYGGKPSPYYINKLNRNFCPQKINTVWASDVTELKVKRNKFYLCVILDLFSRKVIAYRISGQNNTNLTINTFKDAFENRGRPKDLMFHSDQGSNYTCYEFRELLRFYNVNQSFSNSGNPYDNACMESFFSNFKREEYNTAVYEHYEDLEKSVDDFMKYYNEYRLHKSLKNKTPNQVEMEF